MGYCAVSIETEVRKYFKSLDLVREDIREELEALNLHPEALRICDFACGSGITTFEF
jgi:2-polyprenyl-3-methyl-5-hydroxy-6-metoxy-1,4-benzoquinol methylase